ncbi:MAG: methyltransferase domain-containing protein [Clostridiales bacterium]|nr:methyltransferase domain-containing protein [Clostridiales bacterium]
MAKQNIYDNEAFFESFKSIRDSEVNFNDLIETPILLGMLPDLRGKTVLDIGCGMGQHAKQYADMGAASVLGIDISEKMLEYARAHSRADNITYRQMAMEDIRGLDQKFDLVTSSLVFDYIKDFDELMKDVYGIMGDGAEFVFSMSHPMSTAYDGQYPRYTLSESGQRLYANINNYFVEGQRKITWFVDNYELYHRTFSSIVNSMIKAGFVIEECRESQISDELRERYPDVFGGTIHRPDFIFFKCGKAPG